MNKKYLKVYGIENLQNIFVQGFIYNEFLNKIENLETYLIEINFKKYKNKELLSILDIEKVFFQNEKELNNFKATSYNNLPIFDNLLKVKENKLFPDEREYFSYNSKIIKKFKEDNFKKIDINLKLGLFSSLFYYFNLEKKSIININPFFTLLNIKNLKEKFEYLSKNNVKILEKKLKKEEINNFREKSQFREIGLIFNVIMIFLKGEIFEKRVFDNREENYLSIFAKILQEVNKIKQEKNESHEFYMESIFSRLNLDYYEENFLKPFLKEKNFKNTKNILEYLLIIIIKGNFNSILENIKPFEIKEDIQEHIKMICYILKGIFEGYRNLDKEIKIYVYENKIFNLLLNKQNKELKITENEFKYDNLILKNH